jgi:hypothetical protein
MLCIGRIQKGTLPMNKNYTPPTHAQLGGYRDALIEARVGKEAFQSLVDDGELMKLAKDRETQILADRENIRTFELKATVRQDRPYIEALEAGGPDTPSGYNSRKVGDLYPPVSDQEEEVEFVLRNFPNNGSWDKALAWAKSNGYKITNPREAFAVAEQHDLRKLLDRSYLYLVATTVCSFGGFRQAVYVYVGGSSRSAHLSRLERFGDYNVWFLFRK